MLVGASHPGASAAPAGEPPLLLEPALGPRDGADGDSQVTSELAQRRGPVPGAELPRSDEVRQLPAELLVRRRGVVRVEGEEKAQAARALFGAHASMVPSTHGGIG